MRVSLTRILSSDLPLLVSCLMARTNLMACLSSTFLMLSGEKMEEGGVEKESSSYEVNSMKSAALICPFKYTAE